VCKRKEGVGFVVTSNKISGKGAYTPDASEEYHTAVSVVCTGFARELLGRLPRADAGNA
jgi:hypothetical protein